MTSLVGEVIATGGTLQHRVSNAHNTWLKREALLYRVTRSDGRVGIGEAAPLPGYSSDTLAQCADQLSARRLSDAPLTLASIRASLRGIEHAFPAARFAVETALLDLLAQDQQTSIAELLGTSAGQAQRCGLLQSDDYLASASRLIARGIGTAKLKIGRSWPDEIAAIGRLRSLYPQLALRLDANAAWSVDQSRQYLQELVDFDIQFVEQPVAPASMAELSGSPVPLAADESMVQTQWRDALVPLMLDGTLVAVVLKPTVLGGLQACLELANWAAAFGVASVASHSFEGAVGTAAVAELAVATRGRYAAGLDLHAGLQPEPEPPPAQLAGRAIQSHRPGLGVELPS